MKIVMAMALCLLLLASCFARCAMTRESFDGINLGLQQLLDCAGDPYAVHCICDGLEYEYVERLSADTELMSENHYFFRVVNGQVVSKYVKVERRPAYDLMYQQDPNYPTFPPRHCGSY